MNTRAGWLTLALSSVAGVVIGCADGAVAPGLVAPPMPLAVKGVSADAAVPNAVQITFQPTAVDSVRARFASTDAADTGSTPWFAARGGVVTVLGLRAGITYNIIIDARSGGSTVSGPAQSYVAPLLPAALAGMNLTLVSGTPPTTGYTLAALPGPDGHGYLVAFDGAGAIRWYRDFGRSGVQEAKQQTNGDFTVYVGNSYGDNAVPGAFVEVTPSGDSVRTISALGSPYTDGHELVVTSNASGQRTADYLFGYDIRSIDESAYGGGTSDNVAGHQVLRISAAGKVDTLMQGWGYWTPADKIDPPTADQSLDHPNALAFDNDGGIIVSFRNLGAIVKIDPATRAVLWQMGGARNQFTIIGDPQNGFSGQHSVRVLPNGHFLIFDNGVANTPQTSRAVEYAVNESARTATMVWQYAPTPPMFNEFTGSVQRLMNGNTVVAWTRYGLIDEVASNGTVVNRMQLNSAAGVPGVTYRAIRIGSLYSYARP